MPSWLEIQGFVRSKYILETDHTDSFSLRFEFETGRTQLIRVRHFLAFDKSWLEFRSEVCKEMELEPKVALRKNDDFALGALLLTDDRKYCFAYSVRIDTLEVDELELPLEMVARTADQLEREFAGADDN